MPVEKITCVKKGLLKSLTVTTASSKVQFLIVENYEEMYDSIVNLIKEK